VKDSRVDNELPRAARALGGTKPEGDARGEQATVREEMLHSFGHTARVDYVVELPDGTEIARRWGTVDPPPVPRPAHCCRPSRK
jgi:hypothetical protein